MFFTSSRASLLRLPVSFPMIHGVRGVQCLSAPRVLLSAAGRSPCSPELALYMEHVRGCNRGSEERHKFVPFIVDNSTVGYIHPSFLQHLMDFPKVFVIVRANSVHENFVDMIEHSIDSFVTLHHDLKSRSERTKSVNEALKVLSEQGLIPGWRNEFYPVVKSFDAIPFFSLERAAVPYFGTKAYGVHINAYVNKSDGEMFLWTAKRSMSKQTYPGMLDHLVAGGQPEGLSCKENVIKECDEEAGIPKALAERAVPVGAVSYEDINGNRFKRDVLFCYDLELPPDFEPCNKDGEVESFTLLPICEIEKILQNSRLYKPNCALVVLDFLFRHGYISPDQDGYLHLLQSLRRGECL